MTNCRDYHDVVASLRGTVSYISDWETCEMLHMSDEALTLFKVDTTDNCRGKKCYELLHNADYPCAFCTNETLNEDDTRCSLQYNSKLGKWLILKSKLRKLNGRLCRVEQIEEIQTERPWPQELAVQLKPETILLQCAQAISASSRSQDAMNTLLEMVGRFYCADRAYICEFNKPLGVVNNTFEWCAEAIPSELENLQAIPLETISQWLSDFREHGQHYIASVEAELDHTSKEYQLLRMQKIDSLLATPLYVAGETAGFVGVDNPKFHLSSVNLLSAVSGFIVAEMERWRSANLAVRDEITLAYTRNQYVHTLSQYNEQRPDRLGVVLVDINGMKFANETYGNHYGDQLLRQISQLFSSHMSQEVFRIGDDEFAVLCPDMEKKTFEALLERVCSEIPELQGISVSTGSCFRENNVDIHAQLHVANKQLQANKQLYYYTSKVSHQPIRHYDAAGLLEELEDGLFETYCQPQVNIRTGEIIGAEMLIRKHDRDGKIISPAHFVPQYEARGLMIHIDFYVLKQAAATIKALTDQGHHQRISVNFSRMSFLLPDFVQRVRRIFKEHGAPLSMLTLEITESVADMDRDTMEKIMQQLRSDGCSISLDDFGTKYSNLAVLADYDFDEIKFDKSLVDGIVHNSKSRFICKNIFDFCSQLQDADILVEGIETDQQVEILQEIGCKFVQGYYYYRPMPTKAYLQLLCQCKTEKAE